jgi:hypothetical protein
MYQYAHTAHSLRLLSVPGERPYRRSAKSADELASPIKKLTGHEAATKPITGFIPQGRRTAGA